MKRTFCSIIYKIDIVLVNCKRSVYVAVDLVHQRAFEGTIYKIWKIDKADIVLVNGPAPLTFLGVGLRFSSFLHYIIIREW